MLPLFQGTVWQIFFLICVILLIDESKSEGNRVVCYYTNWSVYRPGTAKFNPQNINPYLCTHLIYAFGGFTKDNTLKPFDKYQDIEQGGYAKFTGLKTYNKNLKTLLAIGGWNEASSRFSPLVANPDRRQQFIKNILKFLRQNHFDGLDLDWEYPAHRDGGKPRDKDNYAQFVQELRAEFERESSKTGRPRLLITMAVPAGIEYIEKGYDIPKLNKYLDWFNILSYDYHSAYEPSVNHHAPLYSLEEDSEYNYDGELNIDYTVKFYLNAGAQKDKLVLGIPTYGRSYTLINGETTEIGSPSDGPGEQGDATREKGYLAYYEICQNIREDPDWHVHQPNPKAMGPYAYKDNQWVGYDDEAMARKKGEYVANNGLGGIMFWSIDNDDFRGLCTGKPYPLIEAAKEALLDNLRSDINEVSKPSNTKKTSRTKDRPNATNRKKILSTVTVDKGEERGSRKDPTTRRPSVSRKRLTTTQTTPSSSSLYIGGRTTTPEPPTTPDPGSDFKCEEEGFFQHPRDCKKYFWCLDSGPSNLGIVAHQFTCPSGLYFNPAADSCDFSRNVLCNHKSTTSTTTTTTKKPQTTTTSTTNRPKITAATSRNSFRYSPPTTTTTEAAYEYEDDDEVEEELHHDELDSEEDPKVIKELIDLIKKVGGIEELEKLLQQDGEVMSLKSERFANVSTTESTISKSLYDKVLRRPNSLRSFQNHFNGLGIKTNLKKSDTKEEKSDVKSVSGKVDNKYSSVVRNGRPSPQNEGIEKLSEFSGFLKEKPKYVTINRTKPSKTSEEDFSEDIVDEEISDNEEISSEELKPKAAATTPSYKSIRRLRPITIYNTTRNTVIAEEDDNIKTKNNTTNESENRHQFKKKYNDEQTIETNFAEEINVLTSPASVNIIHQTKKPNEVKSSTANDENLSTVTVHIVDQNENTTFLPTKHNIFTTSRSYSNFTRKTTTSHPIETFVENATTKQESQSNSLNTSVITPTTINPYPQTIDQISTTINELSAINTTPINLINPLNNDSNSDTTTLISILNNVTEFYGNTHINETKPTENNFDETETEINTTDEVLLKNTSNNNNFIKEFNSGSFNISVKNIHTNNININNNNSSHALDKNKNELNKTETQKTNVDIKKTKEFHTTLSKKKHFNSLQERVRPTTHKSIPISNSDFSDSLSSTENEITTKEVSFLSPFNQTSKNISLNTTVDLNLRSIVDSTKGKGGTKKIVNSLKSAPISHRKSVLNDKLTQNIETPSIVLKTYSWKDARIGNYRPARSKLIITNSSDDDTIYTNRNNNVYISKELTENANALHIRKEHNGEFTDQSELNKSLRKNRTRTHNGTNFESLENKNLIGTNQIVKEQGIQSTRLRQHTNTRSESFKKDGTHSIRKQFVYKKSNNTSETGHNIKNISNSINNNNILDINNSENTNRFLTRKDKNSLLKNTIINNSDIGISTINMTAKTYTETAGSTGDNVVIIENHMQKSNSEKLDNSRLKNNNTKTDSTLNIYRHKTTPGKAYNTSFAQSTQTSSRSTVNNDKYSNTRLPIRSKPLAESTNQAITNIDQSQQTLAYNSAKETDTKLIENSIKDSGFNSLRLKTTTEGPDEEFVTTLKYIIDKEIYNRNLNTEIGTKSSSISKPTVESAKDDFIIIKDQTQETVHSNSTKISNIELNNDSTLTPSLNKAPLNTTTEAPNDDSASTVNYIQEEVKYDSSRDITGSSTSSNDKYSKYSSINRLRLKTTTESASDDLIIIQDQKQEKVHSNLLQINNTTINDNVRQNLGLNIRRLKTTTEAPNDERASTTNYNDGKELHKNKLKTEFIKISSNRADSNRYRFKTTTEIPNDESATTSNYIRNKKVSESSIAKESGKISSTHRDHANGKNSSLNRLILKNTESKDDGLLIIQNQTQHTEYSNSVNIISTKNNNDSVQQSAFNSHRIKITTEAPEEELTSTLDYIEEKKINDSRHIIESGKIYNISENNSKKSSLEYSKINTSNLNTTTESRGDDLKNIEDPAKDTSYVNAAEISNTKIINDSTVISNTLLLQTSTEASNDEPASTSEYIQEERLNGSGNLTEYASDDFIIIQDQTQETVHSNSTKISNTEINNDSTLTPSLKKAPLNTTTEVPNDDSASTVNYIQEEVQYDSSRDINGSSTSSNDKYSKYSSINRLRLKTTTESANDDLIIIQDQKQEKVHSNLLQINNTKINDNVRQNLGLNIRRLKTTTEAPNDERASTTNYNDGKELHKNKLKTEFIKISSNRADSNRYRFKTTTDVPNDESASIANIQEESKYVNTRISEGSAVSAENYSLKYSSSNRLRLKTTTESANDDFIIIQDEIEETANSNSVKISNTKINNDSNKNSRLNIHKLRTTTETPDDERASTIDSVNVLNNRIVNHSTNQSVFKRRQFQTTTETPNDESATNSEYDRGEKHYDGNVKIQSFQISDSTKDNKNKYSLDDSRKNILRLQNTAESVDVATSLDQTKKRFNYNAARINKSNSITGSKLNKLNVETSTDVSTEDTNVGDFSTLLLDGHNSSSEFMKLSGNNTISQTKYSRNDTAYLGDHTKDEVTSTNINKETSNLKIKKLNATNKYTATHKIHLKNITEPVNDNLTHISSAEYIVNPNKTLKNQTNKIILTRISTFNKEQIMSTDIPVIYSEAFSDRTQNEMDNINKSSTNKFRLRNNTYSTTNDTNLLNTTNSITDAVADSTFANTSGIHSLTPDKSTTNTSKLVEFTTTESTNQGEYERYHFTTEVSKIYNSRNRIVSTKQSELNKIRSTTRPRFYDSTSSKFENEEEKSLSDSVIISKPILNTDNIQRRKNRIHTQIIEENFENNKPVKTYSWKDSRIGNYRPWQHTTQSSIDDESEERILRPVIKKTISDTIAQTDETLFKNNNYKSRKIISDGTKKNHSTERSQVKDDTLLSSRDRKDFESSLHDKITTPDRPTKRNYKIKTTTEPTQNLDSKTNLRQQNVLTDDDTNNLKDEVNTKESLRYTPKTTPQLGIEQAREKNILNDSYLNILNNTITNTTLRKYHQKSTTNNDKINTTENESFQLKTTTDLIETNTSQLGKQKLNTTNRFATFRKYQQKTTMEPTTTDINSETGTGSIQGETFYKSEKNKKINQIKSVRTAKLELQNQTLLENQQIVLKNKSRILEQNLENDFNKEFNQATQSNYSLIEEQLTRINNSNNGNSTFSINNEVHNKSVTSFLTTPIYPIFNRYRNKDSSKIYAESRNSEKNNLHQLNNSNIVGVVFKVGDYTADSDLEVSEHTMEPQKLSEIEQSEKKSLNVKSFRSGRLLNIRPLNDSDEVTHTTETVKKKFSLKYSPINRSQFQTTTEFDGDFHDTNSEDFVEVKENNDTNITTESIKISQNSPGRNDKYSQKYSSINRFRLKTDSELENQTNQMYIPNSTKTINTTILQKNNNDTSKKYATLIRNGLKTTTETLEEITIDYTNGDDDKHNSSLTTESGIIPNASTGMNNKYSLKYSPINRYLTKTTTEGALINIEDHTQKSVDNISLKYMNTSINPISTTESTLKRRRLKTTTETPDTDTSEYILNAEVNEYSTTTESIKISSSNASSSEKYLLNKSQFSTTTKFASDEENLDLNSTKIVSTTVQIDSIQDPLSNRTQLNISTEIPFVLTSPEDNYQDKEVNDNSTTTESVNISSNGAKSNDKFLLKYSSINRSQLNTTTELAGDDLTIIQDREQDNLDFKSTKINNASVSIDSIQDSVSTEIPNDFSRTEEEVNDISTTTEYIKISSGSEDHNDKYLSINRLRLKTNAVTANDSAETFIINSTKTKVVNTIKTTNNNNTSKKYSTINRNRLKTITEPSDNESATTLDYIQDKDIYDDNFTTESVKISSNTLDIKSKYSLKYSPLSRLRPKTTTESLTNILEQKQETIDYRSTEVNNTKFDDTAKKDLVISRRRFNITTAALDDDGSSERESDEISSNIKANNEKYSLKYSPINRLRLKTTTDTGDNGLLNLTQETFDLNSTKISNIKINNDSIHNFGFKTRRPQTTTEIPDEEPPSTVNYVPDIEVYNSSRTIDSVKKSNGSLASKNIYSNKYSPISRIRLKTTTESTGDVLTDNILNQTQEDSDNSTKIINNIINNELTKVSTLNRRRYKTSTEAPDEDSVGTADYIKEINDTSLQMETEISNDNTDSNKKYSLKYSSINRFRLKTTTESVDEDLAIIENESPLDSALNIEQVKTTSQSSEDELATKINNIKINSDSIHNFGFKTRRPKTTTEIPDDEPTSTVNYISDKEVHNRSRTIDSVKISNSSIASKNKYANKYSPISRIRLKPTTESTGDVLTDNILNQTQEDSDNSTKVINNIINNELTKVSTLNRRRFKTSTEAPDEDSVGTADYIEKINDSSLQTETEISKDNTDSNKKYSLKYSSINRLRLKTTTESVDEDLAIIENESPLDSALNIEQGKTTSQSSEDELATKINNIKINSDSIHNFGFKTRRPKTTTEIPNDEPASTVNYISDKEVHNRSRTIDSIKISNSSIASKNKYSNKYSPISRIRLKPTTESTGDVLTDNILNQTQKVSDNSTKVINNRINKELTKVSTLNARRFKTSTEAPDEVSIATTEYIKEINDSSLQTETEISNDNTDSNKKYSLKYSSINRFRLKTTTESVDEDLAIIKNESALDSAINVGQYKTTSKSSDAELGTTDGSFRSDSVKISSSSIGSKIKYTPISRIRLKTSTDFTNTEDIEEIDKSTTESTVVNSNKIGLKKYSILNKLRLTTSESTSTETYNQSDELYAILSQNISSLNEDTNVQKQTTTESATPITNTELNIPALNIDILKTPLTENNNGTINNYSSLNEHLLENITESAQSIENNTMRLYNQSEINDFHFTNITNRNPHLELSKILNVENGTNNNITSDKDNGINIGYVGGFKTNNTESIIQHINNVRRFQKGDNNSTIYKDEDVNITNSPTPKGRRIRVLKFKRPTSNSLTNNSFTQINRTLLTNQFSNIDSNIQTEKNYTRKLIRKRPLTTIRTDTDSFSADNLTKPFTPTKHVRKIIKKIIRPRFNLSDPDVNRTTTTSTNRIESVNLELSNADSSLTREGNTIISSQKNNSESFISEILSNNNKTESLKENPVAPQRLYKPTITRLKPTTESGDLDELLNIQDNIRVSTDSESLNGKPFVPRRLYKPITTRLKTSTSTETGEDDLLNNRDNTQDTSDSESPKAKPVVQRGRYKPITTRLQTSTETGDDDVLNIQDNTQDTTDAESPKEKVFVQRRRYKPITTRLQTSTETGDDDVLNIQDNTQDTSDSESGKEKPFVSRRLYKPTTTPKIFTTTTPKILIDSRNNILLNRNFNNTKIGNIIQTEQTYGNKQSNENDFEEDYSEENDEEEDDTDENNDGSNDYEENENDQQNTKLNLNSSFLSNSNQKDSKIRTNYVGKLRNSSQESLNRFENKKSNFPTSNNKLNTNKHPFNVIGKLPSKRPRVINRPIFTTPYPTQNQVEITNFTPPTTPSVFRSKNTRTYERKYFHSSTENNPQEISQDKSLLEDLNVDALNARNKKIFEITSKQHTTAKPKPLLIEQQSSIEMNTTNESDTQYNTTSNLNDHTELNNLNHLQDEMTEQTTLQLTPKNSGILTSTEITTLKHIFAIDQEDEPTTLRTVSDQTYQSEDEGKIVEINRVIEISSQEQKLKRKPISGLNNTNNDTTHFKIEIPSHVDKLGEISRIKLVQLVETNITESENLDRQYLHNDDKISNINHILDSDRQTTNQINERNSILYDDNKQYYSKKDRQLLLPEVIRGVETSTIPLEGLFDSARKSKTLELINGPVFASSLGEVYKTKTENDSIITSTEDTVIDIPTTQNNQIVPVETIEENTTTFIEETIVPERNYNYVRPIVPLLRPESNESSPLVISIANLDKVILSKIPKTDSNVAYSAPISQVVEAPKPLKLDVSVNNGNNSSQGRANTIEEVLTSFSSETSIVRKKKTRKNKT